MHTSESSKLGDKAHYSCNIAAVLGQVATGGGGTHLEEQLMHFTQAVIGENENLPRKVLLKYKKERLMSKSKHLRDDASYEICKQRANYAPLMI